MTIDWTISIPVLSTVITIGVIYGTIKSDNKHQTEQINQITSKLDKLDIEQKERLREFREEMNAKFEKYNGLRERMAVSERDVKTLWGKFDEICKDRRK
jgi:hypothetical protein